MFLLQEKLAQKPKCRVQLHVHLEGSIRPETIWEQMKKKDIQLPGNGTLKALKEALICQPKDFHNNAQKMSIFIPAFSGDLEALERISLELVEDLHDQSVAYCEVRLAPFLFLGENSDGIAENNLQNGDNEDSTKNGGTDLTSPAEKIIDSVLKGLAAGEELYGAKTRLILFAYPANRLEETVRLCELYKDRGVVGFDFDISENSTLEGPEGEDIVRIFQKAQEKGTRRTIRAGSVKFVEQSGSLLATERVYPKGCGILENEELYQKCIKDGVHFEMCSHDSCMSGALSNFESPSRRHSISRMTEDGASISINNPYPSLLGAALDDEYSRLRKLGLNEAHFVRANFEAALHSFLPPEEKKELISLLKKNYGVVDYSLPSTSTSPASTPSTPSTLEKTTKKSSHRKPEFKIASWAERS